MLKGSVKSAFLLLNEVKFHYVVFFFEQSLSDLP